MSESNAFDRPVPSTPALHQAGLKLFSETQRYWMATFIQDCPPRAELGEAIAAYGHALADAVRHS